MILGKHASRQTSVRFSGECHVDNNVIKLLPDNISKKSPSLVALLYYQNSCKQYLVLTVLDVFKVNFNISISVRPGLFVMEAKSVSWKRKQKKRIGILVA